MSVQLDAILQNDIKTVFHFRSSVIKYLEGKQYTKLYKTIKNQTKPIYNKFQTSFISTIGCCCTNKETSK